MTVSKARRLLGCEIADESDQHVFFYKAVENGEVIASAYHPADPKKALRDLVETVYRTRCLEVWKRQRYRCADCGLFKGMSTHHIRFRSQGGTHATSNLVGVCVDCHEKRHGRKDRMNIRSKADGTEGSTDIQEQHPAAD